MCDRVIPCQSITRHNQTGVYLHKAHTLVVIRILRYLILFTYFYLTFFIVHVYVMAPTVKRKQFSLEQKKNIISEVDKGLKKGEVAKKYDKCPSTMSTILKD